MDNRPPDINGTLKSLAISNVTGIQSFELLFLALRAEKYNPTVTAPISTTVAIKIRSYRRFPVKVNSPINTKIS